MTNLLPETTTGEDYAADTESVAVLLERLRVWQERCTCDSTPVTECPNYIPADDEEEAPVRVKQPKGGWGPNTPSTGGTAQVGLDTEGRLVHTALPSLGDEQEEPKRTLIERLMNGEDESGED